MRAAGSEPLPDLAPSFGDLGAGGLRCGNAKPGRLLAPGREGGPPRSPRAGGQGPIANS